MNRKQTPRHGHAPIAMRRVEGYEAAKAPGDFYWHFGPEGTRYIALILPGKGGLISLPMQPAKNHLGASWGWDGNEDLPTLTPSIHTHGHWHGWVRAGQMVEA